MNCPPEYAPFTNVHGVLTGMNVHVHTNIFRVYYGPRISKLCTSQAPHFKMPLDWALGGSSETQEEEDETFPELSCLSLTSEYLRISVSWQA